MSNSGNWQQIGLARPLPLPLVGSRANILPTG
jgi:hypothetical protein